MHINNSSPSIFLYSSYLSHIKEGQRYLVEIISIDSNNEGIIVIDGKKIKAKFEAVVQSGDRFWVTASLNEKNIILKRESFNNIKDIDAKIDQYIYSHRGLNPSKEISRFFSEFLNSTNSRIISLLNCENSQLSSLINFLWTIIPKWSELRKNKTDILTNYYKNLGIELEKYIHNYLIENKKMHNIVGDSVKLYLLQFLSKKYGLLNQEETDLLTGLLNEITGQQLWIQTGKKENAYILLHFILQDNGLLYNCRVALESGRKGQMIDLNRSHIAIQTETENLGVIGIDMLIFKDNISIKLLNDKESTLLTINTEKIQKELMQICRMLGYKLNHFDLSSFNDFPQFKKFIQGNSMSGVDIRR